MIALRFDLILIEKASLFNTSISSSKQEGTSNVKTSFRTNLHPSTLCQIKPCESCYSTLLNLELSTTHFQKTEAPSTLIRFQTKRELFCSRYGDCAHNNAESDHRKRSQSKTRSRVERFENDAFLKRCVLVWTEKTMLSENGENRHDRAPGHSTVSMQIGGHTLPRGSS